jgi:putative FmdB family regulatory protein
MPIYEYRCQDCNYEFELMQRITAEPVTVCEQCGGHVERLISVSAFQLKGSGWYLTDYSRSGKAGTRANAGKDDGGSSSESASAGKSDDSGSAKASGESKPTGKGASKGE